MIGTYSTFGDTRRRRRRSFYWRVLRFLVTVLAVAAVGGYGYQVGVSADQARTEKLEVDLARFQQSNLDLRDRLTVSAQRSDQAEAALEELRRNYAKRVPQGELAELLSRIEAKLQAGVEPERLAFLIDAAGAAESCAGAPVTKRFMPRTAVSTGPVSYVRFDDRITVTGAGEPVLSAEGLPEAWYDPALPVRIDFQTLDGAVVGVEGVVPFTHSIAVDRQEYRFSLVAGERGFVEITAQVCALPDVPTGDGAAADALGGRKPSYAELGPDEAGTVASGGEQMIVGD